jgi:uncharacterized protein YggE
MQNLSAFFQRYKKIIISLLLILGGAFLLKQLFFQSAVISVVGEASIKASPAQVEMLVTRVDSDANPVAAVASGDASVEKLISKAKEIAGEDTEIQKSFYQMSPSVATGELLYQVVNVFKVTANDPAKASSLLKAFYVEGATTVSDLNFIPVDQDDVTQEARKAALKDAKAEAKKIARASGKRLGRIVSIGDDLTDANSTISTEGAAADGNQVIYNNGVPSEIDISKSVTVTYNIW